LQSIIPIFLYPIVLGELGHHLPIGLGVFGFVGFIAFFKFIGFVGFIGFIAFVGEWRFWAPQGRVAKLNCTNPSVQHLVKGTDQIHSTTRINAPRFQLEATEGRGVIILCQPGQKLLTMAP